MIFNSEIQNLTQWCREHTDSAEGEIARMKNYYLGELMFKLSTLLDRDFDSFNAFAAAVKALPDIHYDFTLRTPQSKTVQVALEKIKTGFSDYLYNPDCRLTPPPMAYYKATVGEAAKPILDRFLSVWQYSPDSYWYPLCGSFPEEIEPKFFVSLDEASAHADELLSLPQLKGRHVLCCGESSYDIPFITEEDTLNFDFYEHACTDPDFTWLIYFSHEETVSFAGAIVPDARKIFAPEVD